VSFWFDRLPSTDLIIGVPIYTTILITMAWRAVARARLSEAEWTWTRLATSLGGVLFCISDGFIAFNLFYSEIPYAQVWIMTTYYAAQLGLALSVVECKSRKDWNLDLDPSLIMMAIDDFLSKSNFQRFWFFPPDISHCSSFSTLLSLNYKMSRFELTFHRMVH